MKRQTDDDLQAHEKEKYLKVWAQVPEYRKYSSALHRLNDVFRSWQPAEGSTIADLGTGTGVAAQDLHRRGYKVQMYDIAHNCLNTDVAEYVKERDDFTFVEACLWEMAGLQADWAWCFDVMEHIPPLYIEKVLSLAATANKGAVLGICCRPDSFGKKIGEPLHLTVRSPRWWIETLSHYWAPQITDIDGKWLLFVGNRR